MDLSPEVKAADLKLVSGGCRVTLRYTATHPYASTLQALGSLAELQSLEMARGLGGVQGSSAVATFKRRAQAANVQRQLSLNLFMLAGALEWCVVRS